ncbi:hypothetical protein CAPTEDRAFT_217052 [Capitella teleta]|uniref:Polycystic kidney disease protein 1-like 1 n=1 Tax=Capitella teleta TaxID=283909 RepID=R7URF1_CAPTE|nr:hypothetical protein CAPTEDRAFT_217052 [Capitella teleta]|eukprot:ELU08775.1 hypothetical protein CAPTEDRAFT_217052 [Capitella teleta]
MDYGDQDERTSPPIHWDGTGPFKISHLYAHAGVYTVRAIYQHPYTSESVSVITMVSVQEAISGLRIDGPSAVPNVRYHAGTNHSIARQYAWQAVRTAGSDIVYNWTASGPGVHKSEVTAEAQMMREFLAAGVYTLTVKAHNGPGVVHAKKFVHVQFPITRMFIRTEPTILGKASAVFVVVTGGVCRSYSIDFGDANSAHFSCNDSIRELQAPTPDIAGNYSLNISHVYAKVGEYPIRVNVTNAVSSKTIKGVITVEEAISGIQLETSASDVVRLGDIITASVTVATGNNLTFDWLFGSSGFSSSPISVNSSSRSSTATGSLRELGMHSIHVAISSPIYERLGIVVSKSLSFLVHRPIQAVDITALTSKGEPVSSAVLTRDKTGNLTTGAINFLAVAQEGTDVKFYYDFGDGTNRTDVGIYSSLGFSTSKSVVQHAYSRTGDFVVFVRASNPLGDRTAQLDFCVQSAPEGLQLDKDIYSTAFGNVSRFSVSITGGIEVLFDWNMGDGTTKTNAGQSVSHTYTSVGVFNVSVLAFNRVARRSTWSLVKVQSVIQGVELQVIEPVHRYLSSVEFIAKPDPPENNIADYYYFELGETAIATQAKSIFYTYQKHGHYTAKVTAYNNNGQAVSDVEPIHVVEIMSAVLTIEIEGDTVIGQEIRFRAYHFKGSDMTYRWDFGDGEVVNTSHAVTGHTFSKKGAYRVVVVAANFFSNQTKELDVFVLEDICRAPLLEILGEDNQKIPRSKDVIVEVKVELDCLITTTTIYEWKVYNSSESNPVPISGLDKQLFHDPVLVLPRRWLDYGFYSVELRVDMNDTIVHASERTTFEVVASSLMPVISGGILRRCSRQDVVVMDASLSHDPDYPGDLNGLEYAWRCYELDATESSCFIGNDSSLRSGKILEIPGDKFKANVKDIVFELTVSKAGREESTVTQVLKLEASETIDVNILCEQCEDLVVNADERLVLKTQVGSLQQLHRRGSLLFSWNLYFVVNGTRPIELLATPGDEQLSSCLIDLGTPFNLVSNDTDPLTPMVTSSTTSTTTTTAATTSSTTTTASLFNPLYPFGTLDEGESGGRSGGGGAGGLGGFNPGEDTGGGGRGTSGSSSGGLGPSEGAGGGRGTGSGQTGGETDNTGSSENTQGGPGDDVSEKGLLLKGYTYIVEVNVEDTERGIEGSALTYFKVNSSPSRGGCTIRPKSAKAEEPGVEMETVYKVFCQEWRDEDAPIRYEVAYSVDGSEAIDLIYQGLNHEISFTLPAGNLLNDFKACGMFALLLHMLSNDDLEITGLPHACNHEHT